MVVTYYTATYVRGKSITVLQYVEEIKQSWDHLCYAGHLTAGVMLSPDEDHSICLSCEVSPLT